MKNNALVGLFCLAFGSQSLAMDLQTYLKTVLEKNKSVQAYEASQSAAEDRRVAGDIELVPMLSAGVNYMNDSSPLGQFAQLGASKTVATDAKLVLAKKFSSGTDVALSGAATEVQNEGNLTVPAFRNFAFGTLGLSLSQSLWKDAFGSGTRLRWQRQDAVTEAEVGRYDLQKKLLLVEAEAVYWDYIYLQETVKIGKASLDRAKRIEGWTRRRTNDGISDRADLYSAQALVAARQLQLVSAEDDFAAAKRKIRDFLELSDADPFPEITGDISKPRALTSMVDGKPDTSGRQRVMALDAYMSSLNAKASALVAKETDNAYRPDFVLSGAYNTNSFESRGSISDVAGHLGETERPTWKVGLNMVYLFDTSVKNSARGAARKDALAAQLLSEKKSLESESQWIELNRRYSEMSKRVENANEISRLQMAAAKAQTELFNKGRSITANVINAEEDAGTAELSVTKLKSEQRKMEAQGRLFVVVEDK